MLREMCLMDFELLKLEVKLFRTNTKVTNQIQLHLKDEVIKGSTSEPLRIMMSARTEPETSSISAYAGF